MKSFQQVLKLGDEGELVQDLQFRLIELGYDLVYLKDGSIGKLQAEGYFGEVTEACVESFQAKVFDFISLLNLYEVVSTLLNIKKEDVLDYKPTGAMDYATWYVLKDYEALSKQFNVSLEVEKIEVEEETKPDFVQTMIDIATEELGVTEKGGNNYGKRVQEYQDVGSDGEINGGAPWCQYFMNWILVQACKQLDLKYKATYSGYTPAVVNWGKTKKITIINPKSSEVEPGDWGYVYSSARNSAKHVFLVIGKTKKGTVITIEGNTNPGGGSDGFGVFKRERSTPWAIVKIKNLYNNG